LSLSKDWTLQEHDNSFNTLKDKFWYNVFEIMTFKLYIIFFVKKMVPIQLYKVCWNKCSVARFTVYIFSVTLSKDTCSNKLGLSKSPESSLGIFYVIDHYTLYSLLYYPKPRNQYWVADHYKNRYIPQKTTNVRYLNKYTIMSI
jgi:hypothetical protein